MTKSIDIKPGDKFGMLTVVKEVERWVYPSGETRRQFLMQCDCGSAPKNMLINNFKTGSTRSCGCYNKAKQTTHGMCDTRQYQCWADMKTRCDNPKNEFYADYGGRGITYCDKWKTFEGFWEDMAEGYSDDLTLNRRRVNENYCKENCEWDDKSYQGHQRRKMKGCSISVIGGTLDTRNMKMYARIRYKDESLHLGDYETEEEIAEAYDHASEFFYNDRPNGTILTRPSVAARVQHFLDNRDKNLNPKGSNHKMAKLTDDDVREIWKLLQEGEVKQSDIAKRFGVLQANISVINRGEGWNHITSLPIKRRKNRRKKAKETKHG